MTPFPIPDSRSCGDCSACCITLGIDVPELRKQPGVPCQHLVGGGCGIYQTRPTLCREYYCLWRLLVELPDMVRPDRCGVMFSLRTTPFQPGPFGTQVILGLALNSPDDHRHPAARLATTRLVATEQSPVWLGFRAEWTRVFPDEALADAILNPHTTVHTHLLTKAAELRRKWKLPEPPAP